MREVFTFPGKWRELLSTTLSGMRTTQMRNAFLKHDFSKFKMNPVSGWRYCRYKTSNGRYGLVRIKLYVASWILIPPNSLEYSTSILSLWFMVRSHHYFFEWEKGHSTPH